EDEGGGEGLVFPGSGPSADVAQAKAVGYGQVWVGENAKCQAEVLPQLCAFLCGVGRDANDFGACIPDGSINCLQAGELPAAAWAPLASEEDKDGWLAERQRHCSAIVGGQRER